MGLFDLFNSGSSYLGESQAALARWKAVSDANNSINGKNNQAAINESAEQGRETLSHIAGVDAVMGTNNLPKAAGEVARAHGNVVRQLAGQSQAQAAQADQQYLQAQQQLAQQRYQMQQQQNANIASAVGGLVETGLSVVGTAIGGPVAGALVKGGAKAVKNAIKE